MIQSKSEYFHKGPDNQMRPDIVVDLRRPSPEKMVKWTEEEKAGISDFIKRCERIFKAFIDELKNYQ